jgi:crotonobetainyl-CoA:carnitine CoA-transferase CaiB-like acyl-CoA transferase
VSTSRTNGVLAGVRVLDLSDASGLLAGQILADLGADVVQVVPRASPRAAAGTPGDFHWRAYTRGKRLLEIDLDSRAIAELLAGADVLIESFANADAARLGLDPAEVAARFPHLLHVSITPFGRRGPKSDRAATDLTINAASGFLFVSGAAGETPVRISVPQAHAHAGSDAAVATMIALRAKAKTGRGQHIDVSAQHSLTLALLGRSLDGAVNQPRAERSSGYGMVGAVRVRNVFPVRDGWVVVSPGIVPPVAAFMRRLMAWCVEEGLCDAQLIDWDWATVAMRMMQGAITQQQWQVVDEAVARVLAPRTKLDVMAQAVSRKLLIGPVLHVGELLDSPHFAARGYVQRDAGGGHLGAFAQFGRSPLQPNAGHEGVRTLRVPSELIRSWTPRKTTAGASNDAPLAGLKVLDLFWVVAGPGATRMLADYGATVIHVESRNRLDMLRAVPPYIDAMPDPERTPGFHSTHANKLNVSLDLSTQEGRDVLADLIRWADVYGESFSPGVVQRMGFGYDAARALNPDIIMVSSSLLGQTGPWREYAGFGNLAGAVCGFYQLAGRPDAPPAGCFGPYTDFMGVRYNAIAILAALAHRDRTGEGQFIDMAQAEAALHFLAPAALDYLETNRPPRPQGNRDASMAPHGVYPVRGADRWIAIAVRTDDEWQRLCRLAQWTDLANDPALATLEGRKRAEDRIDARVSAWTADRDAADIERALVQLGIAAHALLDTHELLHDAQLQFRGHVQRIPHPQFGMTAIEGSRVLLSQSAAAQPPRAVSYGSHNAQVLGDILGYKGPRIAQLAARGALQ